MDLDEIYRTMSLDKIPWNMETPPAALVELVEGGTVSPCRAADLGCGAGNYVIYLAGKGFDMTGIDISRAAVEIAARRAAEAGVECGFIVADLTEDQESGRKFEFAYDWELLHHIFPESRDKYMDNVRDMLVPGALYLSVCFSEDDYMAEKEKYRTTPLGTVLYYSSEKEIEELMAPRFDIMELKTIEVQGKWKPHRAVCSLCRKQS